jgi:hypothetical protein
MAKDNNQMFVYYRHEARGSEVDRSGEDKKVVKNFSSRNSNYQDA